MNDPPTPRPDLAADQQQWTKALAEAEQEAAQAAAGAPRVRALLDAARAKWHLDDFVGCVKSATQCLAEKDLDTPTSLAVSALTLAAFALVELGAVEQARPLAQRALVLTRTEFLFDQLPIALSCAASVDSISGELDRAEGFHLEALARASEATGLDPLQMALCNLLGSYNLMLRQASSRGDTALVGAVKRRTRRHVAQGKLLKDDARLSAWRQLNLQQSLGEFLGLCGAQPEGEQMLAGCLTHSATLSDPYLTQSIATTLAEQLAARGQYREALTLLDTHVRADSPHRGRFRRRLQATRTAESCLKHLGLVDEAARMAERGERDLQEWQALRLEAIRCLAA